LRLPSGLRRICLRGKEDDERWKVRVRGRLGAWLSLPQVLCLAASQWWIALRQPGRRGAGQLRQRRSQAGHGGHEGAAAVDAERGHHLAVGYLRRGGQESLLQRDGGDVDRLSAHLVRGRGFQRLTD